MPFGRDYCISVSKSSQLLSSRTDSSNKILSWVIARHSRHHLFS